ncbi:MAG: tetratricopeptide repeat protein, partial [Cyanobacteria bacterium]|nr:tetratricopeptide repeat protein [Cyanobacteriota bacterium]
VLDKLVRKTPARQSVYILRGRTHLALQHTAKALADLQHQTADEKPEERFDRMHHLALIAGHEEEALKGFSTSIEQGYCTAAAFYERGELLCRLKQPAKAVSDLTRSIALDKSCYHAYYSRARALELLGQKQAAIRDLQVAIKIHPGNVHVYNFLAQLYDSLNEKEKVVQTARAGILHCKGSKDLGRPYFMLWRMRGSTPEQIVEALDNIDLALQYEPSNSEYLRAKAVSLHEMAGKLGSGTWKEKHLKEAIRYFKAEGNSAHATLIASLFEMIGEPEMAVAQLNDLLSSEPNNRQALEHRANLYFQELLEFEKAESDLTRVIATNHSNLTADLRTRAAVRLAMRKVDDAISDLSEVIRLSPGSSSLWKELSLRGSLLVQRGKPIEGLADFDRSIAVKDSSYARGARGLLHLKEKRWQAALEDLSLAIAENPIPSSYFRARAIAYNRLGRFEESSADAKIFLSREPLDQELLKLQRLNQRRVSE